MIIICSNCATNFQIDEKLIASGGRLVKCGNCQNKWQVFSPLDIGKIANEIENYTVSQKKEQKKESFNTIVKNNTVDPDIFEYENKSHKTSWMLYISPLFTTCITIFIFAITFYPQITAHFPSIQKYYDMLDVYDNSNLSIENMRVHYVEGSDNQLLKMTAQVFNHYSAPKPMPAMLVKIHDTNDKSVSLKFVPEEKNMISPEKFFAIEQVIAVGSLNIKSVSAELGSSLEFAWE